ncbi:spermidine synthase [Pandoraea faecigallinarum]|uniref:Spermidine synthase n=1 Tax=Pandoraea faecigallinarum TaxID=656179 RepID=A0A0H3WYF2_9BURK|nr:fused MFS/spermidine synthase [Pandoraea faecigallinarum]AKM31581.1 spermidine synthase [Pandoraea faecigallinarum]
MCSQENARRKAALVAATLLFMSGAAGLIYQIVWIRQLSLVVGVDVHAVALVVGAFFGGLALGGWYFGRIADRLPNPLRLYAQLECAVLLLGLAATFALPHAAAPFAWMDAHLGALAWGLPLALVIVPAIGMGGTLPAVMRMVTLPSDGIGRSGGRCYAANTLGAIAGTLLVGFVLIPSLGMTGSALAAGGLNGLAALLAWRLAPRFAWARARPELSDTATTLAQDGTAVTQARLALALYAVAGGIALGYEVVWSQSIVQFMSTRTFAFSVVLATYLAGLALGSAVAARCADRVRDPWSAFGALVSAAGLVALLETVLLGGWLTRMQLALQAWVLAETSQTSWAMYGSFALAAVCIVFVPTLLLGSAFPFVLRIGVVRSRLGADVGRVVAWNTIGGIAGSALAGFVLVPSIGLVRTLAVLADAACAIGLLAVWRGQGLRTRSRWLVPALTAAVVAASLGASPERFASLLTQSRGGDAVFYEEGRGATVAVLEQPSSSNTFRRLYIQGVSNSGDAMTSLRYMRLQTLLPLIVHNGEPKSALVIGLGTGITAGAMLAYPGLQYRVVAELLPAVVRAAPNFSGNFGVAASKRVDIRLRDGRRELLQSEQTYDLITLEPPPPSAAGVASLYSTDFYRLAAKRLQPGGLVAQWLPLPTQNDEDTRSLVRSFLDVFPYASLWTTELHETMLIGSLAPLGFDVQRIRRRFAEPATRDALQAAGVRSAEALLATWVTDRAGLEWYAADALPVTDDRPRIEYAGWVKRDAFPQTLANLMALQNDPPLRGADDATWRSIRAEREVLHTFYRAGLDAYRGDRQAWAEHIAAAVGADPENPYYMWFIGRSAQRPAERQVTSSQSSGT